MLTTPIKKDKETITDMHATVYYARGVYREYP